MAKFADELRPQYEAVLKFVIKHKIENGGDSPTIRKIIDGTGVSGTSYVPWVLRKLQDLGYIEEILPHGRGVKVKGIKVTYNGDIEL